jgi:putative ABC transport system permease protein
VLVASVIWIGFLAFNNVRERRSEIGIFRALGVRSVQILSLFLSKAVVIGVLGGAVGFVVGLLVGRGVGAGLEKLSSDSAAAWTLLGPEQLLLALILAPLLSALASWLPAVIAVEQDAANILKEE